MTNIIYGYRILWHDFNGGRSENIQFGFDTLGEAETKAWAQAKRVGWTPAKWWHWWRWNDIAGVIEDHTGLMKTMDFVTLHNSPNPIFEWPSLLEMNWK